MSDASQLMVALREAGAIGGILFDPSGHVVAHSMPALFPDASLRSAGERIVVLYETMSENFEPVSELMLAFGTHHLLLRRSREAFFAVVMSESANREAVKMATNLVFRRLTAGPPAVAVSPPRAPAAPIPKPVGKVAPVVAPGAGKPKKKNDIWGD